MIQFLKDKALWIVFAVIGFFAYRSLSTQIAVASESSSGAGSTSSQVPLYYANAAGYNGVSGSTAAVGGSSDSLSQSLLSALEANNAAQNANNALAITTSGNVSSQATVLNSAVTSGLQSTFAAVLDTFLANPASNVQSLNISATPNATGGIEFNAEKNINLNAIPTTAQQQNYADTSIFGSANSAALSGVVINNAPSVAAPATNYVPVKFGRDNFDAAAYLKANPDVAGNKKYVKDPYLHYKNFGSKEGRTYTALKYKAA